MPLGHFVLRDTDSELLGLRLTSPVAWFARAQKLNISQKLNMLHQCNYLRRQTMAKSTNVQDCRVTSLQNLLSEIHRLRVKFRVSGTGGLEVLVK